jgi:hypothetical protein
MGATAAIMMAGSTLSSSISQAGAAQAQGDFQREMGNLNAGLAEKAGSDSMSRGNFEANRAIQKSRQVAATARTAAAASGVDPNTGSAADVVDASQQAGLADSLTIKNNAAREAWGYKIEAINSRTKGEMLHLAGQNEARNDLLTGTLKAGAFGLEAAGAASRAKTEKPNSTNSANPRSEPAWFFGSEPRAYPQPSMSNDYANWWRK